MDRLEEIKSSLKWGEEVEGKEYAHKVLSLEDVLWLIQEIEDQREDTKLYKDYLDREKDLYFIANEKRKDYEDTLRKIINISETGGNWLEPVETIISKWEIVKPLKS